MTDERTNATWVVIPAYNEAAVITDVVCGVRAKYAAVVVVDDGSKDNTAELARAAGATVLIHLINLGQGAALQTGIDFALRGGAQLIATFDADGQHRAEDLIELTRLLRQTGAAVALGSRFLGRAEGISWPKKFFLRAAVVFQRLTTGISLTDAHNGLRVFTREAAAHINIRQNGMAHASEIIATLAARRMLIVEGPCTVTYTAYSRAKGQRLSNSIRILLDLFVRRLYR